MIAVTAGTWAQFAIGMTLVATVVAGFIFCYIAGRNSQN